MKKTLFILMALLGASVILNMSCSEDSRKSKKPTKQDELEAVYWFKLMIAVNVSNEKFDDDRFRNVLKNNKLSSYSNRTLADYCWDEFNKFSPKIETREELDAFTIKLLDDCVEEGTKVDGIKFDRFAAVYKIMPPINKLRFEDFSFDKDLSDDHTFIYTARSKDFPDLIAVIKKLQDFDGSYSRSFWLDDYKEKDK
jgi:hypothetical protein